MPFWLFIAVGFGLPGAVEAADVQPFRPDAYTRGVAAIQAGQDATAESCFQSLEATPEWRWLADLGRARMHYSRGRLGPAYRLCQQVLLSRPDSHEVQILLGQTLLSLGVNLRVQGSEQQAQEFLRSAESALSAALRSATASADAAYTRALVQLQLSRGDDARDSLREALRREPRHALALYRLAELELEAGRSEQAVARLDILRGQPTAPLEADRLLGKALIESGSAGQALRLLESYVKSRSRDPEGIWLYAKALALCGRYEDARFWLKQLDAAGHRGHVERARRDPELRSLLPGPK